MSTVATTRAGTIWLSRPTAAAAASLVAVIFFMALLGIVFLPPEGQRLFAPQHVSVTHSLITSPGQPAISLFWTIGETGTAGWRHQLAIHALDASRPPLKLTCPQLNPLALAKGIDSDHVLVGDWDGTIYSLDLRDSSSGPTAIARHPERGVVALALSNPGRCIISQGAFHLCAWDLVTHCERWRRDNVAAYCFVLRPDSPAAIVGNLSGEVVEISLHDGRNLRTLARYDDPVLATTLSEDGRQLAVLRSDGNLLLLDSHTGALRWQQKSQHPCLTSSGRFAVFSPCGKLLITANQDNGKTLTVRSAATGEPLRELRGHRNVVLGAAFASDGSLRSWGADGTIRVWNLGTGAALQTAFLMVPHPAS